MFHIISASKFGKFEALTMSNIHSFNFREKKNVSPSRIHLSYDLNKRNCQYSYQKITNTVCVFSKSDFSRLCLTLYMGNNLFKIIVINLIFVLFTFVTQYCCGDKVNSYIIKKKQYENVCWIFDHFTTLHQRNLLPIRHCYGENYQKTFYLL